MGYSALANNVVRRQLFFYFCRHLHPYFVPVGLKKKFRLSAGGRGDSGKDFLPDRGA